MIKRLSLLLGFCCLILPAAALQNVYYPYFKDLKELHYQTRYKNSGKMLFREDVAIQQTREKGENFLVISAVSRGEDGEEHKTISYHTINDNFLSTYAYRIETSKEGGVLQKIDIDYDWEHQMAQHRISYPKKGKRAVKNIPLDQEFIFARDTTILFPSLLAARAAETCLRIMIPSGHTLRIKALFSYIPEDFMIRSKKYSCYRVELKPDLPLFSLVAPKITFWYLSSPPYYFVRYEGPLGGPFSPTVVQEISL